MLSKIGSWITRFSASSSHVLSAALLSILAMFVIIDVIVRAAGVSTYGFYEITILMMVAYVLSGLAFTQSKKAHIWLDILSSRLSSKMQEVLKCLALFLGLGFSILFTWQLVLLTHSFLVKGTFYHGMVPLPYWPAYVVTCLGLILFVIILIADFTQSVKQNIENFRQSPR